jgi:hypothetical protein
MDNQLNVLKAIIDKVKAEKIAQHVRIFPNTEGHK